MWEKAILIKIIKEIADEFGIEYGKELIGMKYKGGSKNGGIDWEYFDKFNPILEAYMESCGDGKSKASQVVTAVNKLVYKWSFFAGLQLFKIF